jgi:chromosome segregation ATPase
MASAMAGTTSTPDAELALRRQLSRLQRQLADAQRELANKEDELSAEFEKRSEMSAGQGELEAELRKVKGNLEDLAAYRARTTTIEQRLTERDAYVEELRTELERERGQQASALGRADEVSVELTALRTKVAAERGQLEKDHAEQIHAIETQKRTALEEADKAFEATVSRMREGQEEELAHLRESHERQLQALRGELEPKALEAGALAEERERLAHEVEALRAEKDREGLELEEAHRRELSSITAAHTDDQNALIRAHQVELSRVSAERDSKAAAATDATRSAEQRESLWEQTVAGLREAQKKLQIELADGREKLAQLEADRSAIEARMAMASRAAESLMEENRGLRERIEASAAELKRDSLDRERFVAYLEEGLAMLGALAPRGEEPEITVEDGDKT